MKRGALLLALLAALALAAPVVAGGAQAPDTEITAGPADVSRLARPTFEFRSPDDPAATFECALEGEDFRDCKSPWTVPTPLSQGTYTLRVRAVGETPDQRDPTPATRTFSIDRNISGANAKASAVQRARRNLALVVRVTAAERVTVSAAGKLRIGKGRTFRVASAEAVIEPGTTRRLLVRPQKRKAGRKARKALKKGKPVEARLAATFADEVGNRATTGDIEVRLRR